jgi:hypothetical protein
MNVSHTLTLMAPYSNLNIKNGFDLGILSVSYYEDAETGESVPMICGPAIADAFFVQITIYKDAIYTLAECPDFKTADAFMKIIESLLNPLKS